LTLEIGIFSMMCEPQHVQPAANFAPRVKRFLLFIAFLSIATADELDNTVMGDAVILFESTVAAYSIVEYQRKIFGAGN